MAMIKYKSPLEQRSGKVGGNIYRYDQSKQHIQAAPRWINYEATLRQKSRRRAFFNCIHRFFHTLTAEEQRNWWYYTVQFPEKNKKGETVYLQAHNMYIKRNINRNIVGKPFIDDPWVHPAE